MKKTGIGLKLAVLAAAAALGQAAAVAGPERVPQSGEMACLGGAPRSMSCADPGLYARARDLSEVAASGSSKSDAARRALDKMASEGACASNAAVSAAAGGKVSVLRRSFKARSKAADSQDREFEDEVLGAENVASFKAPPKFKGAELYTGSSNLSRCGG